MDSNQYSLDTNVLRDMFAKGSKIESNTPVTLQVTNIKPFIKEGSSRMRLILSDGVFCCHAVIRSLPEGDTTLSQIQKTSIITLNEYIAQKMAVKHIVIIETFDLVESSANRFGEKLTQVDEYFAAHPEEDAESSLDRSEITPQPAEPAEVQQPQVQQQQQAPKPQKKQPNGSQGHPNISAIEQLSPYQNSWTIKARVSYKGDMRTWSNQRGEGKLFNVNLLDESDEIRATAFNDTADKFFDVLQEGKVYYVSKARIQQSRPQFSHLSHPYELSLDRDTEIVECLDTADVPKLHFNFVKLNKVQDLDANAIIDVVGVLKEVNPAFQITSKSTGRPFDRRNVTIVDDTQFAISVGLWNKSAIDFDLPEGSVVAFKGAKVQDFGGRSLSLTQAGTIVSNPDSPDAFQLQGWYQKFGLDGNFQSLKSEGGQASSPANRKTVQEAQDENLGMNEKPDYFSLKATISFIKTDNFCYPACNNDGCNRKVVEQSDGTWRCEKCDINHATPNYRYILTISALDTTGQIWLTLFDEHAQQLLGVTAGELLNMKENAEETGAEFTELIKSIQMKEFSFRIRARQDNYNGQVRVRYNAVGVNQIDFNSEFDALIELLEKQTQGL